MSDQFEKQSVAAWAEQNRFRSVPSSNEAMIVIAKSEDEARALSAHLFGPALEDNDLTCPFCGSAAIRRDSDPKASFVKCSKGISCAGGAHWFIPKQWNARPAFAPPSAPLSESTPDKS